MAGTTTEASREPSLWQPLIYIGFGGGAAVGAVGCLAGWDSWALVPICAGVGAGVARLWVSSRRRLL